ncbi:uncharacterized protein LOC135145558 [Zophobas morio]|uniref:uncharacterized protein LOC135145558 n=1 Tax=Zophobas morio TaxID=2755281 RepID=UPI0030838E9C
MPKQDILMPVGDFNAQVERELCYQEVAGPHTLHDVTNQNGEMLCDLATAMNMTTMSTKFKHKTIHKITWMLPGKTTGNQIDHKKMRPKRVPDSIEEKWKVLKDCITESANKTVGYKANKKKTWFDEECKLSIERKKLARIKWLKSTIDSDLENYRIKRKESNKLCKSKKTEWIEKRMNEMEKENKRNNQTPLYRFLRKKRKLPTVNIEDEKWRKHYEKLYEDKEKKSNDEETRINEKLERTEEEQQPVELQWTRYLRPKNLFYYDIVINTKRKQYLENTFQIIEQESKERGLTINESKTKYMHCDKKEDKQLGSLQIGQYSFEEVETFKYLGIIIDRNNDNVHIKQRMQQGYKAFYSNKKTLQDKRLETANITKEEAKVQAFERKVIRTILNLKVTEDGEIRILMNYEIDQILKQENIVRSCKAQRIRCYDHIFRKTKDDPIRILTEWKPTEARPRNRWREQVENDTKEMNVGNRNKTSITEKNGGRLYNKRKLTSGYEDKMNGEYELIHQ